MSFESFFFNFYNLKNYANAELEKTEFLMN